MYFVNTGEYPLLYIPDGGYLENATVPGARWYPFPRNYDPPSPVFIGMAPTWDAYIAMGWYPGMCCWGGYWCHAPYWAGGAYVATPGLVFWIGGHPWYGWWGYWGYYHEHPGWRHTAFFRNGSYGWGAHPSLARPPFRGAGGGVASGFHGSGVGSGSHFGGSSVSGHVFRGVSGSSHSFGSSSGTHVFRGTEGSSHLFSGGSSHSFGGGESHSFSGDSPARYCRLAGFFCAAMYVFKNLPSHFVGPFLPQWEEFQKIFRLAGSGFSKSF